MLLAHNQQLASTVHDEAADTDKVRGRGWQAIGRDGQPLGQHEARFVAVVELEAELDRNRHQAAALGGDLRLENERT